MRETSRRSRSTPVGALALRWIFPGLVIAMVVGNQPWTVSGFSIGQAVSWLVDLAALLIVARFFRGHLWPYLLAGGIVLARLAGSGNQGTATVDMVYLVLLNGLFCAAGVVVAIKHPRLVLRQIRWICLFSVIVMFLQTAGAGEWTQVLATENEGRPKTPYRTLFVGLADLQYETVQARPSGPLHSNNFLSLIVLFALALQFSDERRKRWNRWDVVLAAMAVQSMAKIVFLGTALMIAWLLLLGTAEQRRRMIAIAWIFAALLGSYRFLFPGLFDYLTSSDHVAYSFYIRINDFVERLDPANPLVQTLSPYLVDTPRREDGDNAFGFSGYTHIRPILPYVAVGMVVALPLFLRALLRLRRIERSLASPCVLVGIVAVVYPGAVPFFRAQIYWFIVGFAIAPLLTLTMPGIRRVDLRHRFWSTPSAGRAAAPTQAR